MSIHATARRPIRPSAQLLLCICTNSKGQSRQRPEQTRITALFRCVRELTAGQGCGTWRELRVLPGCQSQPPAPHVPPGPAHRPRAPGPAHRGRRASHARGYFAPSVVCVLLPGGLFNPPLPVHGGGQAPISRR